MPSLPIIKAVSKLAKSGLRATILYSLFSLLVAPIEAHAEKPISEYPEAHAHARCIKEIGERFAADEGENLELARKAIPLCRETRLKLVKALLSSATDTQMVVKRLEEMDYNSISQVIWQRRQHMH
ncbi:hypothetical protein IHQ71_24060 [Rhizobium sp. TH2]|uniref:hypothetical protein n=1 Tax=Rhizobium sp. TH2 TaxID=2775403 RepID=UPI002157BDEA|nr:hypothetical protein [Rhizobium sp. TH2]UVC08199.1 hypothetical protein IHQ71_24060 [Rhizobium sp. TH2]